MGPTLLGCISSFHQTQESPECPVGFPETFQYLHSGCWVVSAPLACWLWAAPTHSAVNTSPRCFSTPLPSLELQCQGRVVCDWEETSHMGWACCCLNLPGWAGSIVGRFLLLWNVSLWWRGQLFSLNTNSGFLCLADFFAVVVWLDH